MSSFMSKLRNIFSPQDEYDDDELEDMPRESEPINRNIGHTPPISPAKVVSINQSNKMEILNFTMLSYDMTGEICSYIKAKKPIIVNMEKIDQHEMQRAVDYLTGASCALNGSVEKITENIFIFAPEHIHINPEKLKQKNIFQPIV
ncbi:cell division protein SepF [Cellulosilyticum sp. I15G10I2]|uniref:cell division protein SepF n=1 Tax=Cellulosilyticum sp. I15G10I2 TaxID=1892843 RepID=UPI00085C6128|nr:cell division protein SepF [Cellulosilyticum sp. I15G10I2]